MEDESLFSMPYFTGHLKVGRLANISAVYFISSNKFEELVIDVSTYTAICAQEFAAALKALLAMMNVFLIGDLHGQKF